MNLAMSAQGVEATIEIVWPYGRYKRDFSLYKDPREWQHAMNTIFAFKLASEPGSDAEIFFGWLMEAAQHCRQAVAQ